MEAAGLDALCVFHPARTAYLTGFHHLPTERPVVTVLAPGGWTALVVPAVEKEHAESIEGVDEVHVYFEYPGERHPMEYVVDVLEGVNANPARTAADHDGWIPHWGYRGPSLSRRLGTPVHDGEMLVEALRRVKSPRELECIEFSAVWAGRAHHRMQESIVAGRTETECYEPAAAATMRELTAAVPGYRPRRYEGSGLVCMFVGGRRTAMPHGFVRGHGLQPGDVLVSGAGVDVDGYSCELERTMFMGPPSPEQVRLFDAMVALQDAAFGAIRPGRTLGSVELEVLAVAGRLGVAGHLRHHVGHSVGLEVHEAPFLDRGEKDEIEPGMVFTVEPGLYDAALGGFRHSDTVVVETGGCRLLTDYPRDAAALTIPV